jgi:hypothetical protein
MQTVIVDSVLCVVMQDFSSHARKPYIVKEFVSASDIFTKGGLADEGSYFSVNSECYDVTIFLKEGYHFESHCPVYSDFDGNSYAYEVLFDYDYCAARLKAFGKGYSEPHLVADKNCEYYKQADHPSYFFFFNITEVHNKITAHISLKE